MKNYKLIRLGLYFGFLFFVATACLKDETIDYTPEREQGMLSEYLARLVSKGHNVDTTAAGVFYVPVEAGQGEMPKAGDTLSVIYYGFLITGEVFDASVWHSQDSLYTFVYKGVEMIEGWDDIMKYMNKGRKVECIIPSDLAYGAEGVPGVIPPFSTIVFAMKMKDIKPVAAQ